MRMTDRIKHAWNAFTDKQAFTYDYGYSSSRPTHKQTTFFPTSSYVSSIYNRIAMDVSMTSFKHVKINPTNEDVTDMNTGLNDCLTLEANIDQTHIQFIQDLVYSMFDEGVVAVVPVDTTISPKLSGAYDINSMRVGKVVNWFPKHVTVKLYNESTGQPEDITIEKKNVAIIENPLYAVVNDSNSTLKRLTRKLNLLDNEDDVGRLDLIVSVPYGIKTETQRALAEKRIADIEAQLSTGRHGIGYIDGTEKVMQLNRPVNSQLPEQINSLTQQFYNQLGLTQNVFNGTASEGELRVYYSRTIDPIVDNIVAEFNRKFLTKTARTQGQAITTYRDFFKIVPIEQIANLGDAFRRNSIASSNELRRLIGLRPSNDPLADKLFNPNIADKNQNPDGGASPQANEGEKPGSLTSPDNSQNGDKNTIGG
jgi:HK97 family phage portal protein